MRPSKPRCPRCGKPTEAERDLVDFRCFDCETAFLEEWPRSGVSGWPKEEWDWYRKYWQTARDKFLTELRPVLRLV